MNSQVIKSLQDGGLTVRVSHQRPVKGENPSVLSTRHELDARNTHAGWRPKVWEEKGGRTVVKLFRGDFLVGEGAAVCSKRDNFCRRVGLGYALTRAMLDSLSTPKGFKCMKLF